jgi:hypothetical protein
MLGLFVLILVLAAGLIYFSYHYYVSEGFADFLGVQTPFLESQEIVYKNYPKEIVTNPGVDNMTKALVVPDIFLDMDTADSTLVAKRLISDPTNGYTDYDNKFCRSALQPANLPRHLRGARDGCGWWYVEEPSLTSVGVLGTVNGPVFHDGLAAGGRWIWDLVKAQELEEIKMCKQITVCDLIDTNAVHGRCGFCPTSGYAVPVKSDGTEKYLNNVAATCGVPVLMNGSDCETFREKKRVVTAPDGTNCYQFGRSSANKKLRIYNESECNNFKGVLSYDGQCTSPDGVNYSESCAELNKPTTNVCMPDINGRLSTACLTSIAKGIGYTTRGAVLRILKNGGRVEENDRVAMTQLTNVGIEIPDVILSGGDVGGVGTVGGKIDVHTAANLYMKLKEQIRIGIHTRVREAAKWFVVGTVNFDPCGFDANEKGPFPLLCVQQLWRTNGCQSAGEGYPAAERDLVKYGSMSWGQISDMFRANYKAMIGGDGSNSQDVSVKKCLGIDVPRTTPPSCPPATIFSPLPTFYSDYNYNGNGVPLDIGEYPFTTFIKHIKNDTLSSLRVPSGYAVIAYQDDIGSRSNTYTYDVPDLRTSGFDKTISALSIRKISSVAAAPALNISISGDYERKIVGGTTYYIIRGNATVKTNIQANVKYFAVGGGGGSGNKNGGGAGGLQTNVDGVAAFKSQYNPQPLLLTPDNTYIVTIGAGGSGKKNGESTIFSGGRLIPVMALGGAFGGSTGMYCPESTGGCGGGGCPSVGSQGGSTNGPNKSPVANAGAGIGGHPKDYWTGGPGITYAGETFGAGAPNAQLKFTGPKNSGGGGASGGNGGSGIFILSVN